MRYFSILFGLLFYTGQAQALTAVGTASVIINRFIAVNETTAMNFGRVYSSALTGDVTLSAAGVRTSVSATHFDQTATAGVFTVTGEPNSPVSITFTNGTLNSGTDSIVLDNLTYSPTSPEIDASGNLTVNVGGRITTAINQATGNYSGNYVITVNY